MKLEKFHLPNNVSAKMLYYAIYVKHKQWPMNITNKMSKMFNISIIPMVHKQVTFINLYNTE